MSSIEAALERIQKFLAPTTVKKISYADKGTPMEVNF
jgi:hypothetical protein